MMQQRQMTHKALPRQQRPDWSWESVKERNTACTCSPFGKPVGSIMEREVHKEPFIQEGGKSPTVDSCFGLVCHPTLFKEAQRWKLTSRCCKQALTCTWNIWSSTFQMVEYSDGEDLSVLCFKICPKLEVKAIYIHGNGTMKDNFQNALRESICAAMPPPFPILPSSLRCITL